MSSVIESGKPADGLPVPDVANASGAALSLTHVTWLGSAADDRSLSAGVSLYVPPGQSVALYGEPPGDTIELLDIVAGLREPLSGQVTVDDVAVDGLSGPELDGYRQASG